MFTVTRLEDNPLLSPMKGHPWEAAAAFNGCPIAEDGVTHLLYRGLSEPDLLGSDHARTSVVGKAVSKDGVHYEDRRVFIGPHEDFDKFGCEDPRVTKLDGKYYIFYTALGGYPYSADNIRIAVAISEDLETVKERHRVTTFNAKAMSMFPSKISGKVGALLTVNTDIGPSDICYAEFDRVEDMWSPDYWREWQKSMEAHKLHIRRLPDDQLEVGAPPILVEEGWLVVYSHIQRYGRPDRVFGIECLLLDRNNPRCIIGRTKGPFMAPEAYYEEVGQVPNTIFPSGALVRNGRLEVYYGAADTHCAVATVPFDNLMRSIMDTGPKGLIRFPGNPVIAPRPGVLWESAGTINPAAIDLDNKTHILYRAVADGNISTLGYAISSDGLSIDERSDKPVYFPRADFETRSVASAGYGCEDPRIVRIGERLYMTYTAYNGSVPRVAVTSISVDDFLAKKWSSWAKPEAISPPNVDDKDAAILPEPVGGRYMIFHRVRESVCADFVDSLDFSKQKISKCIDILAPRRGMWDGGKVGITAPPVKTALGWLLLYHGVSWSTTYRVGAVLLDLDDPTVVKARTAIPLFEPEAEYERKGLKSNVVFPCGLVERNGTLFVYYGAADSVIGVATVKTDVLLGMLST